MIGVISAMPEELAAVVDAMHADEVVKTGAGAYSPRPLRRRAGRLRGQPDRQGRGGDDRDDPARALPAARDRDDRARRRCRRATRRSATSWSPTGSSSTTSTRAPVPAQQIPLLGVAELPADPSLSARLAAAAARSRHHRRSSRSASRAASVARTRRVGRSVLRVRRRRRTPFPTMLPACSRSRWRALRSRRGATCMACLRIARVISDTANDAAAVDFRGSSPRVRPRTRVPSLKACSDLKSPKDRVS